MHIFSGVQRTTVGFLNIMQTAGLNLCGVMCHQLVQLSLETSAGYVCNNTLLYEVS